MPMGFGCRAMCAVTLCAGLFMSVSAERSYGAARGCAGAPGATVACRAAVFICSDRAAGDASRRQCLCSLNQTGCALADVQ